MCAVVLSLSALRYFAYNRLSTSLEREAAESRMRLAAATGPGGLRALRAPTLDHGRLDALVAAEEARIASEAAAAAAAAAATRGR